MYDLLLTNSQVLTMDAGFTQYAKGYIAVTDGKIAAVGPMGDCPDANSASQMIDCTDCVVLPGLINCHTHLPMAYFRGMADDLPLMTWLRDHIWPAENKYLTPDFVYEATMLAAAELIKCGVTCINDMYPFATDVARACNDAGLRGFVGEGVINFPTPSAPTWQDGKRLTEKLLDEYKDHPLITPTVCSHSPYTCSVELLQTMHGLAKDRNALLHIHLHEAENEADLVEWGDPEDTPTHSLKHINVLGPKMIAAHCVWLDDHDLVHMHEMGCTVAHCPTSNLKLGSGIAPVHSMVEVEVPVGVGTDGAASNNNLNLWEEIHLAALLAKGVYKDASVIPAQTALSFATSMAATALYSDHIGVLEVGRRADIVVVELDELHLTPIFPQENAIYSQLVYSAQAACVRDTIVEGRMLLRNGELTQLDENELKAKAGEWVRANF